MEHKVEALSGAFKKLTGKKLILNSQSFGC